MANKCAARRSDSLSLWQRRVTKERKRKVVALLWNAVDGENLSALPDRKLVRAYKIAAQLLEKLGEPR